MENTLDITVAAEMFEKAILKMKAWMWYTLVIPSSIIDWAKKKAKNRKEYEQKKWIRIAYDRQKMEDFLKRGIR